MVTALLERHNAKLRMLFWLLLVFTATMALLPKPPGVLPGTLGDKVEHIVAFATLAILASLAFPAFPPLRMIERLLFAGAGIEVLQSIPMLNRECDALDWLADSIAVVIVVAAFAAWRAYRKPASA